MSNKWLKETIIVTIIWITVLILLGMVADGKQMVHPLDRMERYASHVDCDYLVYHTTKVNQPQLLGFFGAATFEEKRIWAIGKNRFGCKEIVNSWAVKEFPKDSMLMTSSRGRKFHVSWFEYGTAKNVHCDKIYEYETTENRKPQ